MKRLVFATGLAIVLCATLHQALGVADDEFAEGQAAYLAGNYTEAALWLGPAAGQGVVEAQLLLASMYYQGLGLPQDYAQAVAWFAKAAEQGNAEAQTNLGYVYDKGIGVDQDYKQAVSWYRRAAEQGYAYAQFDLGMMYFEGLGVIQSYVEAHKWLNLASSNGHPDAAASREHCEQRMTIAQIAEAQKRAGEWLAGFEKRIYAR